MNMDDVSFRLRVREMLRARQAGASFCDDEWHQVWVPAIAMQFSVMLFCDAIFCECLRGGMLTCRRYPELNLVALMWYLCRRANNAVLCRILWSRLHCHHTC